MVKYYLLGNIGVSVDTGALQISETEYLRRFSASEHVSDICFALRTVPVMPLGTVREQRDEYALLNVPEGKLTEYTFCGQGSHFGFYHAQLETSSVSVLCEPGLTDSDTDLLNIISRCGLHSLLLRRGMPVLHASYIAYQGAAILFAGPSGVGKSTQAALWEQSVGAKLVNGDRVLLCREEDRWYACGYPVCGSSCVCLNQKLPIRAIVLLEQAREDHVTVASPRYALRSLAAGTEVFRWSGRESELALRLAARLTGEVPVLHLACRPEPSAVEELLRFI